MRLIAGVDVGNTTTEVVLADAAAHPPTPLAWDRAPTRGTKGSAASLAGAAALVRRLERRLARPAEVVCVAVQRPVETRTLSFAQPLPPTGRLRVIGTGGPTSRGEGVAVGTPVWVGQTPRSGGGPVVLLAAAGTGYSATAHAVQTWVAAGADVRGVLLADDEGVLVANRLPLRLPVLDEVDVVAVASARLVAMEIRAPGHALRDLGDPLRLARLLGLEPEDQAGAAALTDALADASRAVVTLEPGPATAVSAAPIEVELRATGRRVALDRDTLAGARVASVAGLWLPEPPGTRLPVDDVWAVELREVAASVAARVDPATSRAVVVAALRADTVPLDPSAALQTELTGQVRLVGSEATAARVGALSTPGASPEALVIDMGGGTIDLVAASGAQVIVAGAGEMVTACVAAFQGLPLGAADWVKRGPAARLETPQILQHEDGTRELLSAPAPTAAVGSLVVAGPSGLLAFGTQTAPAAWRALRVRTKQRVLADNLARALRSLGQRPTEVILVGGVAGDEELLALLRPHLPGLAFGRADVAGLLGHRYAVAYGLAALASA